MLKKPFTWKLGYPLFHKKVKIHYEDKQPTPWESTQESDLSWDFQDHHQYQNVLVDNDCDDPLYANVMSEIYQVPTTLLDTDDEGDYANIMFNKDHVENVIYENAEVAKGSSNADTTTPNGCHMNEEVQNGVYENANTSKVCVNGGILTVHEIKNGVVGNATVLKEAVTTIDTENVYENTVSLIAVAAPSAGAQNDVGESSARAQNGVGESSAGTQNGVGESSAGAQNGVGESSAGAQNGVGESSAGAQNGVGESSAGAQKGVGNSSASVKIGVGDISTGALKAVAQSSADVQNGVGQSSAGVQNGVRDSSPSAQNGVSDSSPSTQNGVSDSSPSVQNGVSNSSASVQNGVSDSSPSVQNGVSDSSASVQNGVSDSSASVQNGVSDSSASVQNGVSDSSASVQNGVSDSSASVQNGVSDSSASVQNGVSDSSASVQNGVSVSSASVQNGVSDSSASVQNGVSDSSASVQNGVSDSSASVQNVVSESSASVQNGVCDISTRAMKAVGDSSAGGQNGVGDSSAGTEKAVGDISAEVQNVVVDTSTVVQNVAVDTSTAIENVCDVPADVNNENTATLNGGRDTPGENGIYENTVLHGDLKTANTSVEPVNRVYENTDAVIGGTEENVYVNTEVAKANDCVYENVELAPVIEISDDGSWETKELPEAEVQEARKDQESGEDARRVVMEEQTVRARKIDSWLRDKDAQGDVVYDSILQNKHKTKSYWEQRMMAAEVGPKIVQAVAKPAQTALPAPRTAAMIALELREMKVREEELRRARHEPDEGSCSEYGSEDKNSVDGSPHGFSHQRTQSLDSMSSGHSSGSEFNVARHRVMVKPLDEPQEEGIPVYMRMGHKTVAAVPVIHNSDTDIRRQGETPIEREIRLAREREEELRRDKGLPPVNMSNNTNKTEYRRSISRNALNNNDPRSVQHRLATSRIQQEINEATEREKELRAAGMIQTTSEDTVDSKLTRFTDLADFAIEERERKMKKSVSTSNIPVEVRSEPESSPPVVTPAFRVGTLYNSNRATGIVSNKRFSTATGNKGLMQRFYASHGKVNMISPIRPVINAPIIATSPVSPAPVNNLMVYTPPVVSRKPLEVATYVEVQSVDDEEEEIEPVSARTPVRRGYQSAEEKIQAELQEMQRREEELRLQRAQMFAVSHPNLSSIGKDEDDHDGNLMNGSHTSSNPNLLDSEDSSSLELLDSSSERQPHRNTGRRRIALIQEWENRIMMNTDH